MISLSQNYEAAHAVVGLRGGGVALTGCAERALTRPKGQCDAFVLKLLADGSPDPGFGVAGRVFLRTRDVDRAWEQGSALFESPDGMLVVAGEDGRGGWLMRLLPDGNVDRAFGTAGIARPFGTARDLWAGDLTDDRHGGLLVAGGLVVSGSAEEGERDFDFAVTRLLADGRPDPAFGTGGEVVLDVGQERQLEDYDFLDAVVATDARIVLHGTVKLGRPVRVALHPNGSVDTTCGDEMDYRSLNGMNMDLPPGLVPEA